MGDERILNELVPLLKNYLELSEKDRDSQSELIKELKSAVKDTRDCAVTMKLQIKELETHYIMFSDSCRDRKTDCEKKYIEMRNTIKEIPVPPSLELIKNRDEEIKTLGIKMDALSKTVQNLVIRVYVLIGTAAGIFSFIKWAWPVLLKQG